MTFSNGQSEDSLVTQIIELMQEPTKYNDARRPLWVRELAVKMMQETLRSTEHLLVARDTSQPSNETIPAWNTTVQEVLHFLSQQGEIHPDVESFISAVDDRVLRVAQLTASSRLHISFDDANAYQASDDDVRKWIVKQIDMFVYVLQNSDAAALRGEIDPTRRNPVLQHVQAEQALEKSFRPGGANYGGDDPLEILFQLPDSTSSGSSASSPGLQPFPEL